MGSKSMQVRVVVGGALAAAFAAVVGVSTLGTGQSFATLASGFQQELYGVAQIPNDPDDPSLALTVLGGVAFAPDGDVWSTECSFGLTDGTTKIHRFDSGALLPPVNSTSTVHPRSEVMTTAGCGIVNHPDGHIYTNTVRGVYKLNASTGAVVAGPMGPAGNALGIATDPSNNHVMYVSAGCHPTLAPFLDGLPTPLPYENACKIYDLNTSTGLATDFANLGLVQAFFIDGIYFDPSGTYLFMANRDPGQVDHRLTILRRPENSNPPAVPQIAQHVMVANEPDGVAFHDGTPKFVVTNDEKNGTMTRFDFPSDNYAMAPAQSVFASGGFRGDLVQVGADGCLYATQGRHGAAADFGTRYDNGTTTTEDSIVRICATGGGGFEPPPGVEPLEQARLTLVKIVVGGSAGTGDFTLSAASAGGTISGVSGSASVTNAHVDAGVAYSLSETTNVANYSAGAWACSGGTQSGSQITIAAGQSATCTITNTYQAPQAHLTLVKTVTNNNGGTALVSDFTLNAVGPQSVSGASGTSNVTNVSVSPGTYALSESGPVGYTASAWSCTGGSLSNSSVTLASGQSATCSISNDDQPGHLTLVKNVINSYGGTATTASFTLTATKGATVHQGVSGSANVTNKTVDAGIWVLSETGPANYTASGWSCVGGSLTGSSLTLGPGQSATCTITNQDRDTVNPVCAVYGSATPPYMTFRDTGSGIVRLDVTKNLNTNFLVTITPPPSSLVLPPANTPVANPSAMPTNTIGTYNTATTSLITVTAQRINTSVSAQLIVKATDAFGNIISCDPVQTTVTILRHERGSQTFTDLPYEESLVTIENKNPGLRGLDVVVNGRVYRERGMVDWEVRTLDVRAAMRRGNRNTITLIPRGRPGESADVTIEAPAN